MENLVFVLVHGTFANSAPWIQKESEFCTRLKTTFGENIELIPFNWNGKNLHEDRYSESEILRQELKRINLQYKNCRKIIIAHSHGGNLAVYALRDNEICKNYELITLATPFLKYRVRNFALTMETHKILLTAFFGLFATVIISLASMSIIDSILGIFISSSSITDPITAILSVIILVKTMLFLFPLLYRRLTKFEEELPEFVKTSNDKYSSHSKKEYRVLSIINNKDEIKRWFGLTNYLVGLLFNLYDKSFTILRKLAIYCGAFLLVYIIIVGFLDGIIAADLQKSLLTQIVVSLCVAPLVAFLMVPYLTFFLAFSFLLLKSNPAVYGWENIKYMMFLDFNPELSPENVVEPKVERLPTQANKMFSLKHSIYNDERIFKIMADWIRK